MNELVRKAKALVSSWQGIVIVVIVGSQLLLPLHYYTVRRDIHDERFAWRMFSPMRMTTCAPAFFVDARPVDLYATVHDAWIEIAKRGRFVVIEAMGAELCAKHSGAAVRVSLTCTYLDRPPHEYGGFNLCTAPRL